MFFRHFTTILHFTFHHTFYVKCKMRTLVDAAHLGWAQERAEKIDDHLFSSTLIQLIRFQGSNLTLFLGVVMKEELGEILAVLEYST